MRACPLNLQFLITPVSRCFYSLVYMATNDNTIRWDLIYGWTTFWRPPVYGAFKAETDQAPIEREFRGV